MGIDNPNEVSDDRPRDPTIRFATDDEAAALFAYDRIDFFQRRSSRNRASGGEFVSSEGSQMRA